MGRPVVCFIDDSPFEREMFTRYYPAAAPGWQFVIADTWQMTRRELNGAGCLLFMLDLYGADPENPVTPEILPEGEIRAMVSGLDGVWDDLEAAADPVNEYLKRLHSVSSRWGHIFASASRAAGQGRAYGLYNLARVREEHPGATAVAYSRKAGSPDLVSFMMAGGHGALLKPQGGNDREIAQATEDEAPILFAHLTGLTARNSADFLLRHSLHVDSERATYLRQFARALIGRTPPPERVISFSRDVEDYLDEVTDWIGALNDF